MEHRNRNLASLLSVRESMPFLELFPLFRNGTDSILGTRSNRCVFQQLSPGTALRNIQPLWPVQWDAALGFTAFPAFNPG